MSAGATWRPATLVGAMSLVLGAITLNDKSLWFDETYDAGNIRGSWHHVVGLIKHTEMAVILRRESGIEVSRLGDFRLAPDHVVEQFLEE